MKKYLIILIIFLCCFYNILFSVRLPLEHPKLTSTFGESRKDHFHNGIDFGGGEQKVYPMMDGKIIYYYDKKDFPFDNYMGPGNMVIVQHDYKYRTYYFHLKEGSINKKDLEVTEETVLGKTGNTGRSRGIHLHFTVEKLKPLEVLNPLKFFKEFLTDKLKPTIKGFYIKINDNEPVLVNGNIYIREKVKLLLILKCFDLYRINANRMGVYRIECYINDVKFTDFKFDKLIYKHNNYYLPQDFSFKDIYYSKNEYLLGEFIPEPGVYNIKIIVSDFWGNSTKIKRNIIVKY